MKRARAILLFMSIFAMNLMACDGVLAGPIENVQEFTDKAIRSAEEGTARSPEAFGASGAFKPSPPSNHHAASSHDPDGSNRSPRAHRKANCTAGR